MSEHSPVVALCGSTRFADLFGHLRVEFTMRGYIVLGPEVMGHSNPLHEEGLRVDPDARATLDRVQLAKIALADGVFVVNPDGHIDESTAREVEYAEGLGKAIGYLSDANLEEVAPYKAPTVRAGFTPRQGEVEAVASVAEGQHKDRAAGGRAILQEAFRLFCERSWWVIVNREDEKHAPILWGVFGTEAAAQKAIENNTLQIGGYAHTWKIVGIRERRDQIDRVEATLNRACSSCQHWKTFHHGSVGRCRVKCCDCGHYDEQPAESGLLQPF